MSTSRCDRIIFKTLGCLYFLLFLVVQPAISGSRSIVDSILTEMKKIPDDTNKLIRLSFLVDSLPDGVWQKINLYYGETARRLIDDPIPKIKWKSMQSLAESLSSEGVDYTYKGDYNQALDLFSQSEKISMEIKEYYSLGMVFQNIAAIYDREDDLENALGYYKRALIYVVTSNNISGQILTLSNIGLLYYKLKNQDSSFFYAQEAYNLVSKNGFVFHESGGIINRLGEAFARKGDLMKAKVLYEEGLKISTRNKDNNGASDNYYSLASLFDKQGETEKAIAYAQSSLNEAKKLNNLQLIIQATSLLKRLYKKENNVSKAYEMFELEISSRDTLNKIENKKAVIRNQFKSEYELKEVKAKIEQEKKDAIALKELQKQKLARNAFIAGFILVLVFAGAISRQRNRIRKEKKRSDELLLNILPEEVAEELKENGIAKAKQFDDVSVLFTDFKGFTQISEKLSPTELVNEIDTCFKAFDAIISKYNIEKIKTIGDSYMCASGLPVTSKTHAVDMVNAALEIQRFMQEHIRERRTQGKEIFELRIGIHSGPVVAGIVGTKKFAYDIWGDTVNIASRMESSGEVGKVNISGSTFALVKERFRCNYRGKIEAKNKGGVDMYFVEREG